MKHIQTQTQQILKRLSKKQKHTTKILKKHIHSNINKKGKKLNIEATQTKKHRNKKPKGI